MLRMTDKENGIAALDTCVAAAEMSHEDVAAELPEKAYSTWMAERNPYAPDKDAHKLGLWTLIHVLFLTRNPEPFLKWFCGLFGYVTVRAWEKIASPEDLKSETLMLAHEMGALSGEMVEATAAGSELDIDISATECGRIADRANTLLTRVHRLMGGVVSATVKPEGERRDFN